MIGFVAVVYRVGRKRKRVKLSHTIIHIHKIHSLHHLYYMSMVTTDYYAKAHQYPCRRARMSVLELVMHYDELTLQYQSKNIPCSHRLHL